jgi:hypothetical protein
VLLSHGPLVMLQSTTEAAALQVVVQRKIQDGYYESDGEQPAG